MSMFATGKRPEIPVPETALAGPADADNYRVSVGNERWYTDPLPSDSIAPALQPNEDGEYPAWPSISNVKKASGSDWTFVANNRYAKAIAERPGMFEGMSSGEVRDKLQRINRTDMDVATTRGTNVHLYAEMGLRGKPIRPLRGDEPGAEYLPAVRAFFDAYRPRLVAAEVVCLHRDLHGYGYGGTADAFVEFSGAPNIPDGIYVIDWKSRGAGSNHGAYAEEAAQISGYARAQYMIVEDEHGPARTLLPNFVGGLIVSIKPDGARAYPVDLDKGFQHFKSMHAWWTARRTEKASIGRVLFPVRAPSPAEQITRATTLEELVTIWRIHCTVWTDELQALAQKRSTELNTNR